MQLWFVPGDYPSDVAALRRGRVHHTERVEGLVWIRRDLWESRDFEIQGCYLAQEGDRWVKSQFKLNFAKDCWRKGEKQSFIAKLKSMAGRGRGGPDPNRPQNSKESGIPGGVKHGRIHHRSTRH